MSGKIQEFRCTRTFPYRNPGCAGHADLSVRKGHYIRTDTPEEAAAIMAERYPRDIDAGGTFDIQHKEVREKWGQPITVWIPVVLPPEVQAELQTEALAAAIEQTDIVPGLTVEEVGAMMDRMVQAAGGTPADYDQELGRLLRRWYCDNRRATATPIGGPKG